MPEQLHERQGRARGALDAARDHFDFVNGFDPHVDSLGQGLGLGRRGFEKSERRTGESDQARERRFEPLG